MRQAIAFFFEVAKEGDRPGGGCVFFCNYYSVITLFSFKIFYVTFSFYFLHFILLLFCLVLKSFMLLFHFTAGQKK